MVALCFYNGFTKEKPKMKRLKAFAYLDQQQFDFLQKEAKNNHCSLSAYLGMLITKAMNDGKGR